VLENVGNLLPFEAGDWAKNSYDLLVDLKTKSEKRVIYLFNV
jgi:hypothetical protein